MTVRLRHLPVLLAATATLAVAGCGSSSDDSSGTKLPRSAVTELTQRLNEIQRRYDDAKANDNPGACDDIQRDSFGAVSRTIDALPQDVDPKLRDAVTESFANLQQLTKDGCSDVAPKTDTETTPTETTPPVTEPPVTTPTETTPTETTPPATTPQTPKKPKENGNGGSKPQGGGGKNGNGNGGGTQAPAGADIEGQ